MNARQKAFARLFKLFTDLVKVAEDERAESESVRERAATILKDEFTKIMDDYDRERKA